MKLTPLQKELLRALRQSDDGLVHPPPPSDPNRYYRVHYTQDGKSRVKYCEWGSVESLIRKGALERRERAYALTTAGREAAA